MSQKRRIARNFLRFKRWGVGVVLLVLCFSGGSTFADAPASDAFPSREVYVLVSNTIRPYLEAVEGLQDAFKAEKAISVTVEDMTTGGDSFRRARLMERLKASEPDMIIAVGPEATSFMLEETSGLNCRKLYTMVLNPEGLATGLTIPCGISLNMSVEAQLRFISALLPNIKTIGIPNNPDQNGRFVQGISQIASEMGISVPSIPVYSRSELPPGLAQSWQAIDALWLIPDHTVISESLVKYIIKQAIVFGVPVFGYNRFFYESGAVLSFVIDYYQLGTQTAGLALRVLNGEACGNELPEFQTWLNIDVLKPLGIPMNIERAKEIVGVTTGE